MNRTRTKTDRAGSALSDGELTFIYDFADLLSPWGLAPSAGRVFGYLLLKQTPVSVDQIAGDLGMSRVGAWNSAKSLEAFGHVRRFSQPGSKQLLFAPSDDYGLAFREQATLVARIAQILDGCAENIAPPAAVAALKQRADFFANFSESVFASLNRLNANRE